MSLNPYTNHADDITIVCIDTIQHELSKKSIEHTQSIFPCKEVLIFSDKKFYSDATEYVEIPPLSIVDYNLIVLKQLGRWVKTKYAMIVQYDGIPIDPNNWNDAFLDYDYIGAPWPWIPPTHNVGNGGFSIRSKKLLDFCYLDPNIRLIFDNPASHHEDVILCQTLRGYCEDKGIKYAPVELAQKFSREFFPGWEPRFDGQCFGFHGTFNIPHFLPPDYVKFYIQNFNENFLFTEQVFAMLMQLYKIGGQMEYLGIDLIQRMKEKDPNNFKGRITQAIGQYPQNQEHIQKILAYLHYRA